MTKFLAGRGDGSLLLGYDTASLGNRNSTFRSAFAKSGIDYAVTWCRIPEEQSLQPYHREILKTRKNMMMSVVLSMRYFILLRHSAALES
jgi:hypothetical protein